MLAHICVALAVSLLMATPSLPGLIAWILEDTADPTLPAAAPAVPDHDVDQQAAA